MVVVVGPCPCTQDGGTNSPSVISYPIRTAIGRSAVSDSILTRCVQNFSAVAVCSADPARLAPALSAVQSMFLSPP